MTLREIVYMIMDELKLMSDDSYFNEDHVRFLVNKHRTNILKQLYSKDNSVISESNYQTIEVNLDNKEKETDDDFFFSNKKSYLFGIGTIPTLMNISKTKVTAENSRFSYNISLISKDRMKFVGYNKWLKNIIYCIIEDNQLYIYTLQDNLKEGIVFKVKGIFENPEAVEDLFDEEYPLEPSLVPALIQSVVAELAPKTIQPEDSENNASDDKANLANYISRNQKQNTQ